MISNSNKSNIVLDDDNSGTPKIKNVFTVSYPAETECSIRVQDACVNEFAPKYTLGKPHTITRITTEDRLAPVLDIPDELLSGDETKKNKNIAGKCFSHFP